MTTRFEISNNRTPDIPNNKSQVLVQHYKTPQTYGNSKLKMSRKKQSNFYNLTKNVQFEENINESISQN